MARLKKRSKRLLSSDPSPMSCRVSSAQLARRYAEMVAAASSKEMDLKAQQDMLALQTHLESLQTHGARQAL